MGRCKPLGSLISFLSQAPQLSGAKYCFLVHLKEWQMAASCISPTPQRTMGGGSIYWITVLGALIHIWRPEIDGGSDISCLLIWREIVSFCRYNKKTCSPASHHTPALHVPLFSNYIQILQLFSRYFPERIKSIFSITFCIFFSFLELFIYNHSIPTTFSQFLNKAIFFT